MVDVKNVEAIVLVCNYERTKSWNAIAELYSKRKERSKIIAIIHDSIAEELIEPLFFDEVINLNKKCNSITNKEFLKDNIFAGFNFEIEQKRDRSFQFIEFSSFKSKMINASSLLLENFQYSSAFFFGEISWAYEQLIFSFCQFQGYSYMTPISIRFIDRRWALAEGNKEHKLFSIGRNICEDVSFKSDLDKPTYFLTGLKALATKNRLKKFIQRGFKFKIPGLFWKKILFIIFDPILNLLKTKDLNRIYHHHRKFYFGFHVQPEASIDYIAPEYADQYAFCKSVVDQLENDEILILKSHPGEIHLHNLNEELRLIFNKKIIYLKTNIDPKKYLNQISGVITITGTIGGEFAKHNIHTVSMKQMFFNKHKYSHYGSSIKSALNILRNPKIKDGDYDTKQFNNYLVSNSMPGYPYQTDTYNFEDPLYIKSFLNVLNIISK